MKKFGKAACLCAAMWITCSAACLAGFAITPCAYPEWYRLFCWAIAAAAGPLFAWAVLYGKN